MTPAQRSDGALRWRVQCVDVFTTNVVELDNGVPCGGRTGRVGGEEGPLHPCHCKEVPLRAPLDHHIFQTSVDEGGREVIIVVHQADVSRGEADCQQRFLAVHLWWGVVVRVCVALTTVLDQETGVVPGHADDAIRLMQQNVGQHAPMAVHHYHLSICSTKQHLLVIWGPDTTGDLTFQVDLRGPVSLPAD